MNVARVSKRDFIQYTSKYIKELPVYITNRGKDELYLCKASDLLVATSPKELIATIPGEDVLPGKIATYDVYGCGCEKEEGRHLCKKHGRA